MVTLFLFILLGAAVAALAYLYLRRPAVGPAAKPLPAAPPVRPVELPLGYNRDQVALLVQDPYWLYAYWEITDQKRAEFKRQFGPRSWEESRPALRVYDLTNNVYNFLRAPYFEIAIAEDIDNWYIHVKEPCHTFCVDIGRLVPAYGFVTLARSNIVTTPADAPSSRIDPLWPPIAACWGATLKQKGLPRGYSSATLLRTQKGTE